MVSRATSRTRLRVTFAGVLYIIVVTLLGLAALSNEVNLLFLLFSLCMGVLVFSAVAPLWMLRRLECERVLPDAVVAGRPFKVTYLVRSRRRWTRAWSIVLGQPPPRGQWRQLPQAFLAVLDAGAEVRLEVAAICPVRGVYELAGTRMLCRFPFGLFAAFTDCPASTELAVYPPLGRFRADPWRITHGSGNSAPQRHSRNHEEEFYGIREYHQGDSPSRIHWRTSARTGELVVREMMPLRSSQLIVLLDPWPAEPDSNGGERTLGARAAPRAHSPAGTIDPAAERAISAAATAICDGLERGYRVGLICRAAIPVAIPPAAGRAHRPRLLRELATLARGPDDPLESILARTRWATSLRARCLLCTPAADLTHQRVRQFLAGRTESVGLVTATSDLFEVLPEAKPRRAT